MKTLTTLIIFCSFAGLLMAQSGGEPIAANDFIGSFTMEITSYKKGKPVKDGTMTVDYYFDKYKIATRPLLENNESTTMIFDKRENTMTTLVNEGGEKSGMKMKIPKIDLSQMDGGDDVDSEFSYEKTAETKMIDGYVCRKYLMEGEDYKGHAWVAEDLKIDFGQLLSNISPGKKGKNANSSALAGMKGFPLESHVEFKDKNESIETRVKNIKPGQVDASVFDTSGYRIMDLGNMNFGN